MEIVAFKGHNIVYAEDQPEYQPLPVYKRFDGELTCCWKLSLWERIKVLFTGRMWLDVLTFNQALQPLRLTVGKPKDIV
jgi:hypothetical protein